MDPGWAAGWNRSASTTLTIQSAGGAGSASTITLFNSEAMPGIVGKMYVSRSVSGLGSAQVPISFSAAGFFSNNGTAQTFLAETTAIASAAAGYASAAVAIASMLPQVPFVLAAIVGGTNSSASITLGAFFAGANI